MPESLQLPASGFCSSRALFMSPMVWSGCAPVRFTRRTAGNCRIAPCCAAFFRAVGQHFIHEGISKPRGQLLERSGTAYCPGIRVTCSGCGSGHSAWACQPSCAETARFHIKQPQHRADYSVNGAVRHFDCTARLACHTVSLGKRPRYSRYRCCTGIRCAFLYSLLPIVANTVAGLAQVPEPVTDAARGMGMTRLQRLFKTEFPLAFPVILTGIRIVMVQNIGLTTIAALIGGGGFGTFVFRVSGRRRWILYCWAPCQPFSSPSVRPSFSMRR